jgi:hypothetical protein
MATTKTALVRGDARGRNGGICEKLAAGVKSWGHRSYDLSISLGSTATTCSTARKASLLQALNIGWVPNGSSNYANQSAPYIMALWEQSP